MSLGFAIGQEVMFGRPNGEKTRGVVEKINAKSVKIRQTEARGGHPVGTIWTVGPSLITPISGGTTPTTPVTKPTVTAPTTPADSRLWNQFAPRFGLALDLVGKTFKAKGTEYRITGIAPSRPKFPVDCIRTRDNRPFKFTAQGVIDGLKAPTAPAPRVPLASGLNVGSPVNYQGYQWQPKVGPVAGPVTGVITAINHRDQTVEVFCGTDTRKYKTVGFADVTPAPKRDSKVIMADFASAHMLLEPENLTCDGERSRSECNRIAAILQRALRALAIENGRMVDSSEAFRLSDDANAVS